MHTLAGKIALVTGATRGTLLVFCLIFYWCILVAMLCNQGIGKGIAVQLAQNGAKVYITGRTLKPNQNHYGGSLEETAEEVSLTKPILDQQQQNFSNRWTRFRSKSAEVRLVQFLRA